MRCRIAATQLQLEPDLILPRRRTSKVSHSTGRKVGGQRVATVAANLKCTGVVSQASRRLQQQPCTSLTGVVVFNVRHATNLAAGNPQLQWLGGALVRCGEGRGPAPFFGGGVGWADTPCAKNFVASIFTGTTFQNFVILCDERGRVGGRLGRKPVA